MCDFFFLLNVVSTHQFSSCQPSGSLHNPTDGGLNKGWCVLWLLADVKPQQISSLFLGECWKTLLFILINKTRNQYIFLNFQVINDRLAINAIAMKHKVATSWAARNYVCLQREQWWLPGELEACTAPVKSPLCVLWSLWFSTSSGRVQAE